MRVLVTGGAGYIGSITAQTLLDAGHELHILDDLSSGHRAAIPDEARFVEGRVQDPTALAKALEGCEAVIHFASLSLVGESVERPLHYFRENVGAMLSLLEGMARTGASKIVFSSSAAVYGQPDVEIIDERQRVAPINPYGHSKAMAESILREECRARDVAALSLRYFNACGAAGPRGEDHSPETHLIPRLCAHLQGRLDDFTIFGGDYPTPDGTAVRDYIHVRDLARAHLLAISALKAGAFDCINLGSGSGHSVRQIVDAAARIADTTIEIQEGSRRQGDPPRLVASNQRAAELLGWRPECSNPERILADAWHWHLNHPNGYAG